MDLVTPPEEWVIGPSDSDKLVLSWRWTAEMVQPEITWTRDLAQARKWSTRTEAEADWQKFWDVGLQLDVFSTRELAGG